MFILNKQDWEEENGEPGINLDPMWVVTIVHQTSGYKAPGTDSGSVLHEIYIPQSIKNHIILANSTSN